VDDKGMTRSATILALVLTGSIGCSGLELGDEAGESETTSDASTGSGESTAGTDTTDTPDTADTTTSVEDTCLAACELQDQCAPDPFYGVADCVSDCTHEFEAAPLAEGCPAALSEFYTCVGGLTCAELDQIFETENNPCYDEVLAYDELCSEVVSCDLGGGGDDQGSYCSYQYDCYGGGLHRVECNAEAGCTCLLEGVEVGSCDQLYPALCEPLSGSNPNELNMQIVDRMQDCCGWVLEL
jgi:hypothetical protein